MNGLLPMVRRVRRPLVVGTGGKGSPPPAAVARKEQTEAADTTCQGKECQTISAATQPGPKAKAEGAVIAGPGAPPPRGRNNKAGA